MHHLYIAFWGVICHLPPIKGTRNNHWISSHMFLILVLLFPYSEGTSQHLCQDTSLKTVLRVRNGIISNTFYVYDVYDIWFWKENRQFHDKHVFEETSHITVSMKPGWDLPNSYDTWSYFMIVIIVVDLGHQPIELFVHNYSRDPKHFQSGQTKATHHGNHVLWYNYTDLCSMSRQPTKWEQCHI